MRLQSFTIFIGTILLSISLLGQRSVAEIAREDQVARKLWSALGPNLNKALACDKHSATDELASEFNMPQADIRSFLIYTLNYSTNHLQTEQVRYRYPHYNIDSVKADFHYLVDLGLLNANSSGFEVSELGEKLLDQYWLKKIDVTGSCSVNDHLKHLARIAGKLMVAYEKIEQFQSVRLRLNNRSRSFDEFHPALQACEYQKDLSAVFNDNGHYRFDWLLANTKNSSWETLQLSPLAKELLGATRNQRSYAIDKCSNQSNWHVGRTACTNAAMELSEKGLVEIKMDTIHQTNLGKELFQAADDLADDRLYSVWNVLAAEEYEQLLEAIEWVRKSNI